MSENQFRLAADTGGTFTDLVVDEVGSAPRFYKRSTTPSEPVIGVFDGEQARAYPTWVLDGHEIVNDRLSQLPIAATW